MAKRPRPGPKRARGSPVKALCAYKACKSGLDVKNTGKQLCLKMTHVKPEMCRPIRGNSKCAKFCCATHMRRCRSKKPAGKKRGPREPLSENQVVAVFNALLEVGAPWCAALVLLQISLAERASAVISCQYKWLSLGPDEEASVSVPRVNGKTSARKVPLAEGMAALLRRWLHGSPLQGHGGAQWPFPDQPDLPDSFLFPGAALFGFDSCWREAFSWKKTCCCFAQASSWGKAKEVPRGIGVGQ